MDDEWVDVHATGDPGVREFIERVDGASGMLTGGVTVDEADESERSASTEEATERAGDSGMTRPSERCF